jgi:hypothetical protein
MVVRNSMALASPGCQRVHVTGERDEQVALYVLSS